MAEKSQLGKNLCADVREVLEMVDILSSSDYRIADHPREPRGTMVEDLTEDIYRRLYLRPTGPERNDDLARRRHIAQLQKAYQGDGPWEPGWMVREFGPAAEVLAERRGITFRVPPSHRRCSKGDLEPGRRCEVRLPATSASQLPGFYLVRGNATPPPRREQGFVLRLYWHLRAEGAVPWVSSMADTLDRAGIPFEFKVLNDPLHYHRADAGVLYLSSTAMPAVRDLLLHVWRAVHAWLRPTVPLFTLPLAPGLGLAEGPADRSSFGNHRSRLIAGALLAAWNEGRRGVEDGAAALATAFRAQGLDPTHPHLAPASTSLQEPGHSSLFSDAELNRGTRRPPSTEATPDLLDAACQVGDILCRSAFRQGDQCNWLGYEPGPAHHPAGIPQANYGPQATLAALGPGLYDGSAGVGLFLAALYSVTDTERYRQTALSALRRSLAVLPDEPRSTAYFTGDSGVLHTAGKVALWTGSEALLDVVQDMELKLVEGDEEPPLDLLNGDAGTILAYLARYRETGSAPSLERAIQLGEGIRQAAQRQGSYWAWPNKRTAGMAEDAPPLTGLSHGAAGLGLALLELFQATGSTQFLTTARRAFAYEDACFDATRGNWPDFRQLRGTKTCPSSPRFMTTWCHGAPGIALSRLRAMKLDPERAAAYEEMARAGLATTARSLRRRRGEPALDTGLCHGTSGLIELMHLAGEELPDPAWRQAAHDAAEEMIRLHLKGDPLLGGSLSRMGNPSLFLGSAGVGYTFLRLRFPEKIPSPFFPLGSMPLVP